MRRREFITLLGGAAAWPLTVRGQQPAIGFLHSGSPEPNAKRVAAFRTGLSETGHVEGRNVAIEFRWAAGHDDRLPELAADLIHRQVAVIATPVSTAATKAAKAATATIPIVFAVGGDPVKLGLVASLNRPGGNATGISILNAELTAKRLGLLHELVPKAARFIALLNPNSALTEAIVRDLQAGGPALGLPVEIVRAGTEREIDAGFASISQRPGGALMVPPDEFFFDRRAARRAGGAPRAARDLSGARICRCRRAGEIWARYRERVSAVRRLPRPHPQGREVGRPAGSAADQVRAGDQT